MEDVLLNIPPLTQSAESTAACPRAYVATYLEGKGGGESIPSERGHDVHHVMSRYIAHCALNRIPADWSYFNLLTANSGPVAGPMLEGIRDRYVVDFDHVYQTECSLGVDRQFNPAYIVQGNDRYPDELPRIGGLDYSPAYCAYLGTLDVIYLSDDGTEATIEDFKTHPSIFNVDAEPQGERYAFMLFKHMPSVQKVTFKYNFVRYTNAFRFDSWDRSDMPAMQASMGRALERQMLTVLHPDQAKALPCTSCTYCPLAKDMSCPVAEWNEYTTLTMPQRVMWKVWLGQMNKLNNPILKSYAEVRGTVRYEDGNGRVYEYGEQPVASTRYPLDRTALMAMKKHREATGEDLLDGRLNISSTKLKSLLKAKKRAELSSIFEESIIEMATKPKYAVRTPEGVTEDYNPYAEED
jgi:hypothetical protein